jgi:polyhydroxybutyrate depolymerase
VAYPQGVVREKGAAEWDPGDNGSRNIKENDVYFAEQLISDISNEYNVDLSRVYATGYSNGGMMAYGLACSKGNRIAAAGIMSGIMLQGTCDVNEYTSIIHFHGIADDALPYDGNQDFQPVSDVIDFWLNHNNIPTSSLVTTELNGGDVVRDEYTGGNESTSVVLYTINSEHDKPGGHVWFSDDIGGTNPNQILWDFLSNYSLDD